MEALPLRGRGGRANCMSNIQQDMIEQTLAILASMMQQAAHDATLYCADISSQRPPGGDGAAISPMYRRVGVL